MTIPTDELLRPIIGIANRTPLEVFDIMCDRIRRSLEPEAADCGVSEAAHDQLCPLHWISPGTLRAKCWCNGQSLRSNEETGK